MKNIPWSAEDSDNEQSEAHESCANERRSQKPNEILAISLESEAKEKRDAYHNKAVGISN